MRFCNGGLCATHGRWAATALSCPSRMRPNYRTRTPNLADISAAPSHTILQDYAVLRGAENGARAASQESQPPDCIHAHSPARTLNHRRRQSARRAQRLKASLSVTSARQAARGASGPRSPFTASRAEHTAA